jgi:hypothetical protein
MTDSKDLFLLIMTSSEVTSNDSILWNDLYVRKSIQTPDDGIICQNIYVESTVWLTEEGIIRWFHELRQNVLKI